MSWNEGMLHNVAAAEYSSGAPAGYTSLQTRSNNMIKSREWDDNMLKTSDYNGYIQDTPISHIAPRTSAFNLQRAPWEAYQFKDERAAALNTAA
jgi:hypothetical protein